MTAAGKGKASVGPDRRSINVRDLALDLENFRTVPQKNEVEAVEAMIAVSADRFWALTESLLEDGYLPTENVIVLNLQRGKKGLVVKEGNRRVAALKLLLGYLPMKRFAPPKDLADRMRPIGKDWRDANSSVPCSVFPEEQAEKVDRIVDLAHGKGEKAGRDQWNAIARSRHNRKSNSQAEPALDLLEKYLANGRNVTGQQRARWAGDYPLSVLEEAMKRLAPVLGVASAREVATNYPKIGQRELLEVVIHDIGSKTLGFELIRDAERFAEKYGITVKPKPQAKGGSTQSKAGTQASAGRLSSGSTRKGNVAYAANDPRAVRRALRGFVPRGNGREKLAQLKEEAQKLDLSNTPLAFAFVLRSMFEISAKAYCDDHKASGLTMKKASGEDRHLVDVLRDVTRHLTKGNADKAMVKALHGAMTELGKSTGLLSVTSMNQLVHNPRFSVAPGDIAIVCGNVFPLLEAMNA